MQVRAVLSPDRDGQTHQQQWQQRQFWGSGGLQVSQSGGCPYYTTAATTNEAITEPVPIAITKSCQSTGRGLGGGTAAADTTETAATDALLGGGTAATGAAAASGAPAATGASAGGGVLALPLAPTERCTDFWPYPRPRPSEWVEVHWLWHVQLAQRHEVYWLRAVAAAASGVHSVRPIRPSTLEHVAMPNLTF